MYISLISSICKPPNLGHCNVYCKTLLCNSLILCAYFWPLILGSIMHSSLGGFIFSRKKFARIYQVYPCLPPDDIAIFPKNVKSSSNFCSCRMLEAENDHSSTVTVSSQPSFVGQAETLDIDEPMYYVVYCCGAASTIIMQEHPSTISIRSRKEARADPLALTKH